MREALAIRRKVFGDTHRETATSLNDLALLLFGRGDLDAEMRGGRARRYPVRHHG